MALMHASFFSDELEMIVNMDVILPQITKFNPRRPAMKADGTYPTIYLLHGLSDDHTMWMRYTSIERYVSEIGCAVVMPNVHQSFYCNMAHGLNYWNFVSEELPRMCRSFFPNMSPKREDNFAIGVSMGGYGAIKLGLLKPESFAAVASLSGALDLAMEMDNEKSRRPDAVWQMVFGDKASVRDSDNDLLAVARRQTEAGVTMPKLYIWCGSGDFLLQENHHARDVFTQLGLDVTYSESQGYHAWNYWDEQVKRVLDWLPFIKTE